MPGPASRETNHQALQRRRPEIPSVIVIATPGEPEEDAMTLSERVTADELDSEHFASQLIERLRWAVGDAHQVEQTEHANNGHERPVADTTDRERALAGASE